MRRIALTLLLAALLPGSASAEPQFLSKQYPRCATCHYSPTGGGLLTPYGRALSRYELSTTGGLSAEEEEELGKWQEEQSFYGLTGDLLGPVNLGMDLLPTHLEYEFDGGSESRNFWMRADLQVAVRHEAWTAYGEVGRLPGTDPELISREHWLGRTGEDGFGFRVGRFMPAYGVRLADHTALTRRSLGFDQNDQLYGLELSQASDKFLMQWTIGTRAESLFDDDGRTAFNAVARIQWEPRNRHVLVFSGMFRGDAERTPWQWLGGVAWGWSPWEKLTLWTELNGLATDGWDGTPTYAIRHETAFEVYRGVWLKFSPQLLTDLNNVSGGTSRIALGVQFFPRTHWNINFSWQRDRDRLSGYIVRALILQLHIYL